MLIDALIIAVETVWKARSLVDIAGIFLYRSVYSAILAAVWHAIEQRKQGQQ